MLDYQEFAQRVRAQGGRMTPQRQIVLEAIRALDDHASVGEIYEWVAARAPAVNRATVYRVLRFLCDAHLVAPFVADGVTLYELVGARPHHHLVCRQCGCEEPVPAQALDVLVEALCHEYGFQAELRHLAITGLCQRCRGAGASSQ